MLIQIGEKSNYTPLLDRDTKQTNSLAFSPQANYTDRATNTCWRNLVPTSADRGVLHGQRGVSHTVVNLSFLDRDRGTSIIYCSLLGDTANVEWKLHICLYNMSVRPTAPNVY
jgi:hypothetical protein